MLQTLTDIKHYYQENRKLLLHNLLAAGPNNLAKLAKKAMEEGVCEVRAPFLGSFFIAVETL